MKNSILSLILLMSCLSAAAQNNYFELYTDSAALKKQNDELIADIEKEIKSIAPSFSFKGLTTEIPNTFMPGQYREKTNRIYLNTWQVGGPPMKNFLKEVTGSEEDGEKAAGLFFYGFFLPHEVGHALHYKSGNVPGNSYDAEYEANEIAVAYWRSKGRQRELQQCYEMARKVLEKLPNPIPADADPKKYVTEHYWDLVKDPYKYGYIQFSQIVKVMEDKTLPDFEGCVRRYL